MGSLTPDVHSCNSHVHMQSATVVPEGFVGFPQDKLGLQRRRISLLYLRTSLVYSEAWSVPGRKSLCDELFISVSLIRLDVTKHHALSTPIE